MTTTTPPRNLTRRGFKTMEALRTRKLEVLLTIVLLLGLVIVLMQPTVKSVRTVELKPEGKGVVLDADTPLVSTIETPGEELSYFVVWVKTKHKGSTLSPSDYESLLLEVTAPDGTTIRTTDHPQLVKRVDKPALVFKFDPLVVQEGDFYTLTVSQAGHGLVWAEEPLNDMIEDGETIVMAFQLGKELNWITSIIDKVYEEDLLGHDISYYHHRGYQITEGINPYACIVSDSETCIGYPSHLPGMYMFAAGLVQLGVDDLDAWAAVWRPIMLGAWLGVGLTLLVYLSHLGQPALGVAALGLWLFNRWSLYVLRVSHTDFLGVLFLVLSFISARRLPLLAAFLLGISLSIKPVAAVLVPLFLIVAWRMYNVRGRRFILLLVLLLLVPVAVSLPLYIDNPEGMTAGVFNPVTRPAQTQNNGAPSFDRYVDITHLGKSLPMIVVIIAVYVAAWRKSVDLLGGAAMIMGIVIAFTHVLFTQYYVWFVPFIPLALARYLKPRPNTSHDLTE